MNNSVDDAARGDQEVLMLYHDELCGYCMRVRSAIEELGLTVELRDIHKSSDWAAELREARGRMTVPVLRRIKGNEEDWMPESSDIVDYLRATYG